ncbi:MAG: alpha/beta fold hydrolase [Rickettsiales bacterium]|jgi:polyhydroxyalkanoate synthase
MLAGVLRYYETPYQRTVPEPPAIWQRGSARLLDYGQKIANPKSVVLFIPSLINRYYILDLEEERSFLRYLARQEIYPLVLDWGEPNEAEKNFSCGDYVTEILSPAIDFISKISAQPVALAGYCMGGLLALAAAKLKHKKVSSLALLATPWNFHCPEFSPFVLEKKWQNEMAKQIAKQKTLPAEMIQSLFYLTDPFVFEQKFRRYVELDPSSRIAKDFVALEHWVNDGVPMTSGVAHDSLIGWAQENKLIKGEWIVDGKKITPPSAAFPTFIAIPKNDHVVPFECAMPLARASKNAHIIHPSAGHVGMIVGRSARRELWQPYAEWLLN